jgi:hypothetical protein
VKQRLQKRWSGVTQGRPLDVDVRAVEAAVRMVQAQLHRRRRPERDPGGRTSKCTDAGTVRTHALDVARAPQATRSPVCGGDPS